MEPPLQQQQEGSSLWKTLFQKKWHPKPTANQTIVLLATVGVLFFIIGIIINVFNSNIQEIVIQSYQQSGDCQSKKNAVCTVSFEIQKDMKPPIFVFYKLENFYQNHRRYIKSKSSSQLSGNPISLSEAKVLCDPIVYNSDIIREDKKAVSATKNLPEGDLAIPCGLIANSLFNDTYILNRKSPSPIKIEISEKDIAWPEDKGTKFKNIDLSKQWYDMENEHFIVWMRTAGLPNFRKLWGRIQETLVAGSYEFQIKNDYDVDTFDGQKSIVLSTSGPLGGKNQFLAIAYIIVGVLCFLIGIIFFAKKKMTQNKFGAAKQD